MPEPLLDRHFLEKLERLTIRWQKSFAGLVGGHNISRFAGGGQEFLDHRHFHPGDDLRAINWRAYLRMEKLFLKMFQVEPRVPIRILLDTSASMGVGAKQKFDFARRLAAALTYIGLVRHDTIALMPFAERLGEGKQCGGGRHRFGPVADYLGSLESAGRSNFFDVVRQFMSTCPQRGLLILISDFLDDREIERPLQYLADFGHELSLVQVWAEEDRVPPWTGELELLDAETGEELRIEADERSRVEYTRRFDEFAASLEQLALRNGGRYAGVSTAKPIEAVLFESMVRTQSVA